LSIRAASVLAVGVGSLLAGTVSTPSAAAVAAKGKCKRGQMLVTVQGRKTCRPLGSALPRPQRGDQRLSIVESAMMFDPSALRDRDGKQLPSPAEVYGSFGPGAYDAVRREVPRALASLDRLTRQDAAWRVFAARTPAAACPSPGAPIPIRSDSYRSDLGGGVTLTVTAAAGVTSSITLGLEKGTDGLTVELDLGQCQEQQGFKAALCPTSAGIVEGTYNSYARTATTLRKSGVVTYSLSLRIKQLTKLRGQVGEDAKLDSLAIDDSVTIESALAGTSNVPVSFTATVKRQTRVDMHTGNYDPGAASLLGVSVDVDGVANDAEAVAAVAGSLQKSSGKDFAEAVARAIKEYRQRESGWNKPNTCATLRFAPGSYTLHLETGQSGRITGHVEASRGGTAPGRWHLTARQNATYSPTNAQGMAPAFDFHVTRAGRSVIVSATFRVTSKAGVAESAWQQGTKAPLVTPRRWTGGSRFSYRIQQADSDDMTQATETAEVTLVRLKGRPGTYQVETGTITWEASGKSHGCTWTAAGSRAATKYDLVLELDIARLPYKAVFSGQDDMLVPATETCPDQTSEGPELVLHPFFLLGRKTAGVPVDAKLTKISGSSPSSQGGASPDEQWTYDWSFEAAR